MRQRLWPGGKVVSIATSFENDDQRILDSQETFERWIGASDNDARRFAEFAHGARGESNLPWYARWMDRQTMEQAWGGEPLTTLQGLRYWRHRTVLLLIRARRWLIWTAPFVGTAYVVIEMARWLWP